MFCDEDKKLIKEYYSEMKRYYPQLDKDLVYAICRQAVEEGIRDSDIVWEWLHDEI